MADRQEKDGSRRLATKASVLWFVISSPRLPWTAIVVITNCQYKKNLPTWRVARNAAGKELWLRLHFFQNRWRSLRRDIQGLGLDRKSVV